MNLTKQQLLNTQNYLIAVFKCYMMAVETYLDSAEPLHFEALKEAQLGAKQIIRIIEENESKQDNIE